MNGLLLSMPLVLQSACQTGETRCPLKESLYVNFQGMRGADCGTGATQGGTEAMPGCGTGATPVDHYCVLTENRVSFDGAWKLLLVMHNPALNVRPKMRICIRHPLFSLCPREHPETRSHRSF